MRKGIMGFFAAISSALLVACAGQTTGPVPAAIPQQPPTIEPITPEEDNVSILLYTSMPDVDALRLVTAFEEAHPGVSVEIFRSGTEEVISRLYAEREGGRILADVILVADEVTFVRLKQDGLLLPHQSPNLAYIDPVFVDPDFMFTGTKAITSVIAYNTDMVETSPTDWADIITPAAYNNVFKASPLHSGAAAYQLQVLTRTPGLGWEFFEALQENNTTVGTGNGGVITSVVMGENAYGIVVDFMANNSRNEGNPINFVYPIGGSIVITEPIGIIYSTQNPDASKLFVDFVLSYEGQQLQSEMGYVPLHRYVAPPEGMPSIDNINRLTYDVTELYATRESDQVRFSALFN